MIHAYYYSIVGHVDKCIDKYCELGGVNRDSLKPADTPGIDDHLIPADVWKARGELAEVCARIVLTCLYVS